MPSRRCNAIAYHDHEGRPASEKTLAANLALPVASLSLPVSRARSHGAKYTVTGGHRVTVLGTRHRSDSDSEPEVPGFRVNLLAR